MGPKLISVCETDGGDDVLLTPWSIVHYFAGGTMRNFGLGLWEMELLHGLYELKDQQKQEQYRNSLLNTVGDQAVATLGYMQAHHKNNLHTELFFISFTLAVLLGDHVG